MNLLALETSTEACSVALQAGARVWQRHRATPQGHTQHLLPMVRELCAEAGMPLTALDGLAVGIGPGAFTGVRIACAVAQGLAFALALPIAPVSTLAALARGGWRLTGATEWLVATDARRAEVYWASGTVVDGGRRVDWRVAESLVAPSGVQAPGVPAWACAGSGWQAHGAHLPLPPGGTGAALVLPEAQDVLALGEALLAAGAGVPPDALTPTYLRSPF